MPAKTLCPPVYQQLEDINGATITGGTVTFLETGTAVLAVVFSDANGAVISANPLTVDAAARWTVFLTPGQVVDVEFRDASGTLVKTVPAVSAIPGASGNIDVSGVFGQVVTAGQVVYLSDGSAGKTAGRWWLAETAVDSQSLAFVSSVGIVLTGGSAGATGTIRIAGQVTDLTGLVVGARYYVSATPGVLQLTPSSFYRTVGQADTTTSLVLFSNPLDTRAAVQATAQTGAVAQIVLTLAGAQSLNTTNATLLTIQGIKAGYDGQRLRIVNFGNQVDLIHQSPSAAPEDRFTNIAQSGPTSLGGGGTADYEYSITGVTWKLIAHEQGAWLSPAFNAADYTGTGGMTWLVTAGGVGRCAYYLKGRQLQVQLTLNGTGIGGTPGTTLQRTIPGGYTSGGGVGSPFGLIDGSHVPAATYVTGATTINFNKDFFGTVDYQISPTGCYVRANILLDVF